MTTQLKATERKAWARATAEGLRFFWATTAPGSTWQCVATDWEDAGFTVNDQGDPVRDANQNTVTRWTVEELDPANRQHVDQVMEWWA